MSKGPNRLLNYFFKINKYVSLKEIMGLFDISRRTAFNWLSDINGYLNENDVTEIENIPNHGYKLPDYSKRKLEHIDSIKKTKSSELDKTDRVAEIVWLLVSNQSNISINKLSEEFDCSRNTIIKDFKEIKQRFVGISIVSSNRGRRIANSERYIRLMIYELIQRNNQCIKSHIVNLGYDWDSYYKIVIDSQKSLEMNFSENSTILLTYLLIFSSWRIKNSNIITDENGYYWIAENTHGILTTSERIVNDLFDNVYYAGEIIFLSKIVLCSQVMDINCVNLKLYSDMEEISKKIIFRYEKLTNENLINNSFVKILSNHLYATFFRVKFNMPYVSNEVDEIKKKYPKLIQFTSIACEPLEVYLDVPIPENEIALICLYFGSGEDNEYSNIGESDRIQKAAQSEVLLVCSSGIGTSEMLYSELSKKYPLINFSMPLEIKDLDMIFKIKYQSKLIISTASIEENRYPIPTIKVKAILTKHDQIVIEDEFRKYLPLKIEHNTDVISHLMSIIGDYANITDPAHLRESLDGFLYPSEDIKKANLNKPSLRELLTIQNIKIMHTTDKTDWTDVLHTGCLMLNQRNVIDSHYENEIIKLVKKYGPYMLISDDIFLAHASPKEGSKKVGISMVLLDNPVTVNAKGQRVEIRCMFVLAPGLNHEHDRVLEELISIVRNTKKFNQVLNSKDKNKIRRLMF
ncbi:PTS sugar transporter subunit IIA [Companilactobacillus sp. FL22-1]|uniref:PTS sugar transporter subunit IIA n=1 Tax=Companilactobacillus sp. FL22-1 TaxID=3373892 RepID=UPI003753ED1A